MVAANVQSKIEGKSTHKMLSPFLRIALLLGVCVHLAGFFVFRVISNPLPTRGESRSFVQYVSPDTLQFGAELEERASLFDSSPLFVPGQWNAAHNLEPPSRDRTLLRFPAYEPEIDLSSALVSDDLPVGLSYAVTEPTDLLALRYWDLFRGFGEEVSEPRALKSIGVFAEVRSSGGKVLQTVPAKVELLSMQAVKPVTYFQGVEAGGRALGRPTLSISSGDVNFDAAAYTWLTESGLLAELPAGFFEIRIYP